MEMLMCLGRSGGAGTLVILQVLHPNGQRELGG